MDDKQIVDLYWERSETAISETAKKYGRYCHYIAFNVLHNDEDSEETGEDVTRDDSWSRRKYKTAVRFILHGDENYSGFHFATLTDFIKFFVCHVCLAVCCYFSIPNYTAILLDANAIFSARKGK